MSDDEEVTRVTPDGRTGRFMRELEAALAREGNLRAGLAAAAYREQRLLLVIWVLLGVVAVESAIIAALAW